MKKPQFEEYWIIFLVCMLVVFFTIGCSVVYDTKVEHLEHEAETHPLPEEDSILEKLIELGEVEKI